MDEHDSDDVRDGGQLTRRDLTKFGLLAAGAALSSGSIAACSSSTTGPGDVTWTHEADIICVGGGAAALTAAAVAHSNGDTVIVMEAMPALGGTTAKSGGVFWIPNNRILRAKGIVDAKPDCLRYMARFGHPAYYSHDHPTLGLSQYRYDMLSAIYDHAAPMVEHLEKIGVFRTGLWDSSMLGKPLGPAGVPIDHAQPDYGDVLSEERVVRGRSLCPYREDGTLGTGGDLVRLLAQYVRNAQQPILLQHRVRHIVQNASGAVIGVGAETGSGMVFARARKAVIFGSGGYAQNLDLREKFQKERIYGTCSGAGSQGDLIPAAARAGAALGNLASAWRADGVVEEALGSNGTLGRSMWYPVGDSMIFVNKHGKRIVNEYRSYHSRAKAYAAYDATAEENPNQLRFMIFDQRTRDLYAGTYPLPPAGVDSPYLIKASSIEELGAKLRQRLDALALQIGDARMDARFTATLAASIARFNQFARSGKDEDFGRGDHILDRDSASHFNQAAARGVAFMPNPTMYPIADRGPYYAVIVGMAVLDTNGGPVINTDGQVVDYAFKPIPGFYAAGNCAANPGGSDVYFAAGATIGPAMTFAYLAANAAHREPRKGAA